MTEDVKRNSYSCTNQIQSYETLVCKEESNLDVDQGIKLGWIEGVLVPCLLSIWGVMLFLRIPWIVAQAGIFSSVVIIIISLIIITITTFSLSAICSNGRVKGGGLYFIISRSIGPEFGASIGILLALANAISVALNTVGFCLSFRSLLQSFDIDALDTNFGFILTGFIAILVMGALCAGGMDDEAKVQNVLLVIVVSAIFDVIIGSIIGPTTDVAVASGFSGFSVKTFKKNWDSDYRPEDGVKQSFFTIFAVFFPSVTGIQAGANISGDLKDPSNAIPKGTLWSIIITITSYIVLVIVSGSVNSKEASGFPDELQNDFYLNCSFRNCSQGLFNNENLMQTISWWPYLIYFGCFAATLSTALTSLIAVPKILKRMGQDDVYPFLKYLVKGYGKSNEPYRAHYLAVVVSSIFLLMGDLNTIASFISTIYLCAYALLNVCTFHVAHFKPLGWRPTYRFYNKWLSLAGAVICFAVMLLIDKTMSVFVGCIILILYFAAARKTHGINWGSSSQTQQIKTVIKSMYKANTVQNHVKNYIPNIMVLSGTPKSRKELVYLAHLITKNNGLQTCVNVEREILTLEQKQHTIQKGIKWLNLVGVKSLYNVLDDVDLDVAVRLMINCGHGILKSNIVLVGYKNDWFSSTVEDVQTYLNTLHVANTSGLATLIVRLPSTTMTTENSAAIEDAKLTPGKNMQVRENDAEKYRKIDNGEQAESKLRPLYFPVKINHVPFSFVKKRHSGVVDVWWLFDDGGLALTISHIFKSCDTWKKCTFRIFGVTNEIENLDKEKIRLKQLLAMYRVRFDFIDIVLANTTTPKTMANFRILWEQQFLNQEYRQFQNDKYDTKQAIDTLYIRDLLETYSSESDLIIMTSIFKIKEKYNQIHLYWMEIITRGLPPCILIQGNVIQTVTASA